MTDPSPIVPATLSPAHVRAARAVLAWSRKKLAEVSGVARSTVIDFERGSQATSEENLKAILDALQANGIEFGSDGKVLGPAVPMISESDRPGTPVRWVTADDLAAWAARVDGPVHLPTLVSFLIRATHGPSAYLHFPADGGVRHPGWDGLSHIEHGSTYVPAGDTGWELSAQREKVSSKIDGDYNKRTDEPQPLKPAAAACIFVTLQHWPNKERWVKSKMTEGPWREVRVYDTDDLVHWIELTPAVGLWLATHLGKRPNGTRELDAAWKEWSLATRWPLTEDLVLCDRDESAAKVLGWLRSTPSVLSLQSTSSEEVVAFFHAVLSELPEDASVAYRARSLVVDTAAARALANAPAPLVLVLTDPDPGLAESLVANGHFVLQAYDEGITPRGDVLTLERPSREGIATVLRAAGVPQHRVDALARDSARNLTVLRRLIPVAHGQEPNWAKTAPPRALIASLLAGGWDEDHDADRTCLSGLARASYEQFVADLTPFVGRFDSPLQKIGPTWRITSPYDAWLLLARYLATPDIDQFEAAAHAVLGAVDARFEMAPQERWMAGLRGADGNHSGLLRHGIGQVLILLALWGDQAYAVNDASRRADAIVTKLLRDADQARWWSLSRDFRLLAEASPPALLSAIEDSLDQHDPPISVLFGRDEGGIFGTEHLSDLMWALETLAWSPDLLPRVTLTLARLAAIDVKPRSYSNGPANSLREVYLLWNPQTFATLDERLLSLDSVRKREPDVAWKLMLGILPTGHDSATPSQPPMWRDFSVENVEVVTWKLIDTGAVGVSRRLLDDVGTNASRWISMLEKIGDVRPDPMLLLDSLDKAESRIIDKTDRNLIWDKLRRVLHHNREFATADWSLPSAVLDRMDEMYSRFAPTDALEQVEWLFQNGAALPNPSEAGWSASQIEVDKARVEAAKSLFSDGGSAAILALARMTETPGIVGKAIYDACPRRDDIDSLIEKSLRSDNDRERGLAHGLIVSTFHEFQESWGDILIKRVKDQGWGEEALIATFLALPTSRWTWEQVAEVGGDIEDDYWRRTPTLWIGDDANDVAYAIRHLIDVGRARPALSLTRPHGKVYVATDLLIELLEAAVRQPLNGNGEREGYTMFQHYVAEAFKILDGRDDVKEDVLVMLEWRYLSVLEHSSRPAKALLRALSEQPSFFVEILRSAYRPSKGSGIKEEEVNPEQAGAIAIQADRLLSLWNRLPGTKEDGAIDLARLEAWVSEARAQASAIGRADAADRTIGEMLSASPMGVDGNWPAEAVREVLDQLRSRPMRDGFYIGRCNRRGMTTRMPRDGGEQERTLSAQYRAWAKEVAVQHPYTSRVLHALADGYDRDAGREDESAKRLDWEG